MRIAFPPLAAIFAATQILLASPVQANYDVLVGRSGSVLTTGFHSHGGTGPAGGFSVIHATGQQLFTADFGDFAGGPRKTDAPGFQGFAGTLAGGTLVSALGIGALRMWSPSAPVWAAPTGGETIRLDGAIPTDVVTAYLFCQVGDEFLCDPSLAAQYGQYVNGTRFGATAVSGPNPALIDDAAPNGSFHAHLDWSIERPGGTPATGAYLLSLRLTAPGYVDSAPFSILFNHGLSSTQFQAAFQSLTVAPAAPVPEPEAWILMSAGLLLTGALARRARSAAPPRLRSSVPARD